MASDIINIPAGGWKLLSRDSISFQSLHDQDYFFTEGSILPTFNPYTPGDGAYNVGRPFIIYNHNNLNGNIYVYAKNNQGINIAVGPFEKKDVFIQDQTTLAVEHWLSKEVEEVTLQTNINKDSNTIVLDPFTIGSITGADSYFFELRYVDHTDPENKIDRFFQAEIITITDNVTDITLEVDTPLDFNADTAFVELANITDVDISRVSTGATPGDRQVVSTTPPNGISWDLTRLMVTAVTTGNPDDSKWFDQPALMWGTFFGFRNALFTKYLVNLKANAGFRASAYDVTYTSRTVPQGSYGVSVRKSFGGQDKYGVVVRLNGENDDEIIAVFQDDFSAINTAGGNARIKVMGHEVD